MPILIDKVLFLSTFLHELASNFLLSFKPNSPRRWLVLPQQDGQWRWQSHLLAVKKRYYIFLIPSYMTGLIHYMFTAEFLNTSIALKETIDGLAISITDFVRQKNENRLLTDGIIQSY